jgi:hypothetical protein
MQASDPKALRIGKGYPSPTDPKLNYYRLELYGDTYPHRAEIKRAGFAWNAEYGRWEFRFAEPKESFAEQAQTLFDALRAEGLEEFFPEGSLTIR